MVSFDTRAEATLRARDVEVELTSRRLRVALKEGALQRVAAGGGAGALDDGDGLLAEGGLAHPIDTDARFWWIEEGRADSEVQAESGGGGAGSGSGSDEHGGHTVKLTLQKRVSQMWAGVWYSAVEGAGR